MLYLSKVVYHERRPSERNIQVASVNKLPDIIYLHGLGSSPSSNKARLVLEHLRSLGHGMEAPHLNVPSLEKLSAHEAIKKAAAVIKERAQDSNLVLIGSSFGGFIGLHALQLLDVAVASKIKGVVLLAPALYPWHPTHGIVTREVEREWEKRGLFPIEESATGCSVDVHVEFIRELKSYNSDEVTLGVRTLIIHGDRDEVVSIEQSKEFSKKRREVNLVTLADTHALLKHPSRLLELVSQFVSSCATS